MVVGAVFVRFALALLKDAFSNLRRLDGSRSVPVLMVCEVI